MLPRLLILGLDALEYDIVTRFRFKAFMQRDYGKIDLTRYRYKLITPWLWSIIISGHVDTGITHFVAYENRLIGFIARIATHHLLYKKVERFFESIRRRKGGGRGTAYMLHKIGVRIRPMGKQDLKVRTIFEEIPNSIAISVPGYNLWREQFLLDLYYPLTQCIGDKELTKKRLRLQWMLERKKKIMLEKLLMGNDWSIIMAHFYITDVVGHLYWNKPIMLIETYKIVSRWVTRWKRMLEARHRDAWVLIVSDHGMRGGLHTDHAFWSSNFVLKRKPSRLTDYYNIILSYFNNPELVIM